MGAEGAWSCATQLEQEANTTEPGKRFHLLSGLRRAAKRAEELERLCDSNRPGAKSKLEAQAKPGHWITSPLEYLGLVVHAAAGIAERSGGSIQDEDLAHVAHLPGMLRFEQREWKAAMEALTKCKSIYEKPASAFTEEQAVLYNQRVEELSPDARYRASNVGRESRRYLVSSKEEGLFTGEEYRRAS